MAASSSSNPIAASATTSSDYYDVFINHRGPDVKETLATHLYQSLIVHGLRVFLDKEELQEGDHIPSHLKGAIGSASVHIAIFSKNYAESNWCLNELRMMLESGKTVIPIFYGVKPSELRWTLGENGMYARAMRILEGQKTIDAETRLVKRRYESKTIAKWREALSQVADIKGFEMEACNSEDRQLVDKVVKRVLEKLPKTPLNVSKYPTGLDDKVNDFKRRVLSSQNSGETRVVGIVGFGGVGKTTLATEFFNRESSKYRRSCFLPDVREKAATRSISSLQNILLNDLTGSNVQINSIAEGIEELRRRVSSCHPHALIILDDVDNVDQQLDVLLFPLKDALRLGSLILVTSRNKDVLRSFGIEETFIYKLEGLNRHHSQELFCSHAFDQAYAVKGFEQLVEDFLDACHGLPLSLQVIGSLLRGKKDLNYWKAQLCKIIKILPDDIQRRLKISYDSLDEEEKKIFLDIACFFIGENRETATRVWGGSVSEGWLGFWKLENRCLVEVDFQNRIRMHDHLRDLGRDLAEKEPPGCELRLWRPSNNFIRDLSRQSHVRGISMVHGNDASYLLTNMSGSQLLGAVSFVKRVFSVGHLPQPIYVHCVNSAYSYISSLISLKNLRVLYIEGRRLRTLWRHAYQAPLELRELIIYAKLQNIPKSIGKLKHLEKFVLRWNDLKCLPDSFGNLTNLQNIDLVGCSNLQMLPDSFGNLTNLQHINLGGCSNLHMIPDSFGNLTNLQHINLSECSNLQMLVNSIGNMTNLQSFDLSSCKALQMLPNTIGNIRNLQSLDLGWCSALEALPDSIRNMTNLRSLNLEGCSVLEVNLQSLDLSGCCALQMFSVSFGNMTNLRSLNLRGCSALRMLPHSVGNITNLESLYLEGCSALRRLPDLVGNMANLQSLDLRWCYSLQMLPNSVGNMKNLKSIDLRGCFALQMLPDSVGNMTNLQYLDLTRCYALQRLPDSVGHMVNLQSLNLSKCYALQRLPDSVGNMTNLQSLNLSYCLKLEELHMVEHLSSLKKLNVYGCSKLQLGAGVVEKLRQRLRRFIK